MLIGSFYKGFWEIFNLFLPVLPFVTPVILTAFLLPVWYFYKRFEYRSKIPWLMLEVRLPKEIFKSPKAMEAVLATAFNQSWEGNWWGRLTKGVVQAWFSLELVSFGGKVHFFIRTSRLHKDIVESQIYAQYPEVEIYEVPDYALSVYYDEERTLRLFGAELKLSKADPYPIKTYVDYGLDSDVVKEELKVDPLTQTIEFLGALGPEEQAWIQILVKSTRKRKRLAGKLFKKGNWRDEAEQEVKRIMSKGIKPAKPGETDFGIFKLTPGETEVIKAIERSVSKTGFDCGVRILYLASADKSNISHQFGLLGCFRQYGTLNLNGFTKIRDTNIDYPWQDFREINSRRKKRRMLAAYRRRAWFYPPFARRPFVLNSEELATIYHFPGGVVTTPSLSRIPSKKGEPPANLPF